MGWRKKTPMASLVHAACKRPCLKGWRCVVNRGDQKLNQLVVAQTALCKNNNRWLARDALRSFHVSRGWSRLCTFEKNSCAAMKAGKSRVDNISNYYFMALSACYQGPSGCTMDAMKRFNWVTLRTMASDKAEKALGNRGVPAALEPEQAKIVAEFLALIIAEDLANTGRGTFADVVTTPDKKSLEMRTADAWANGFQHWSLGNCLRRYPPDMREGDWQQSQHRARVRTPRNGAATQL